MRKTGRRALISCIRFWFGWLLFVAVISVRAGISVEEAGAIRALLEAAKQGDIETVKARLDAGMPVDAMLPPKRPRYPNTVRTPLEAAAIYTQLEVVALLLERGATLRRDERNGVYPASIHNGDSPELLAMLVDAAGSQADLDVDFGPALIHAAANGSKGEVAYLLGIGVDPDFRAPSGTWVDPAIVRANTHFEIVELLLDAGADPMGGDLPYQWSPLFPAAGVQNAAMVRRLLEIGVDPHRVGDDGNALSLAACSAGRGVRPSPKETAKTREVVALLLERGVDPNESHDSRTPLRCAEDAGNKELAAMLSEAGGRSYEDLWYRIKAGTLRTAVRLFLLLGGDL